MVLLGTASPCDAPADSRLHSAVSSLSYSQGLGLGLWATGWDISLASSITQYQRDQGWPRHPEELCSGCRLRGPLLSLFRVLGTPLGHSCAT